MNRQIDAQLYQSSQCSKAQDSYLHTSFIHPTIVSFADKAELYRSDPVFRHIHIDPAVCFLSSHRLFIFFSNSNGVSQIPLHSHNDPLINSLSVSVRYSYPHGALRDSSLCPLILLASEPEQQTRIRAMDC